MSLRFLNSILALIIVSVIAALTFTEAFSSTPLQSSKSSTVVKGDLLIDGANNKFGKYTWLPHEDGNTYIGPGKDNGSIILGKKEGNTKTIINGPLHFYGDFDNTDTYKLEKKKFSHNNSELRFTINDDANEAVTIFGNSCAAGNCGGEGQEQHRFTASGEAKHKTVTVRKLCVDDVCIDRNQLQKIMTSANQNFSPKPRPVPRPIPVSVPRPIPVSVPRPVPSPSPAPSRLVSMNIVNKNTPNNDFGGGNTIFLDRHNIECDNKGVLNRLKLERPSNNSIRYAYNCKNSDNISVARYLSTSYNDEGHGNSIYLDRHHVSCPSDTALSRLQLQRDGKGKYRYDYRCSHYPSAGRCSNRSTPNNDWGNGNMIFLDRHDVKCNPNEVLTSVRLVRPTSNTIRYNYTCCEHR